MQCSISAIYKNSINEAARIAILENFSTIPQNV